MYVIYIYRNMFVETVSDISKNPFFQRDLPAAVTVKLVSSCGWVESGSVAVRDIRTTMDPDRRTSANDGLPLGRFHCEGQRGSVKNWVVFRCDMECSYMICFNFKIVCFFIGSRMHRFFSDISSKKMWVVKVDQRKESGILEKVSWSYTNHNGWYSL